jgi:hypothetical protein
LPGAVTKLASITFWSLAFSYWTDKPWFLTEGKLVVVFITPSLGVPNWPVIYIINTAPSAILPPDLREDPAFAEVSEWSNHPSYGSCLRRQSGLLGDEEYDYGAPGNAPLQVPWVPPPPEEEEDEEVVILVEEYAPWDLSKEEAIRRSIEESELIELGLWDGLGTQLKASMTGDHAAPPPRHHHLLQRPLLIPSIQ